MNSAFSLPPSSFLVVGGAGFVGGNLVRALLEQPLARVTVVDNLLSAERDNLPQPAHGVAPSTPGQGGRIDFREGSIADDLVLAGLGDQFDYIFHLATYHGNQSSIHDPLADHQNNTLTTLKLLWHVRNFRRLKKLVYSAAGCAVAAKTAGAAMPTEECDTVSLAMDSPYSISKIAGEFYSVYFHRQHGVPVVRARFQNVYGPGEVLGAGQWRGTPATVWRNVTPTFVYKALHGWPLPLENEGIGSRDFIYVDDICRGLMLCASRGEAGDVYNLASGRETTIRALADMINRLTQNPAPCELLPKRPWDNSIHRFGSTVKALRQLGFQAEVDLETGLERTIAWTRDNLPRIEAAIARHRALGGLCRERWEIVMARFLSADIPDHVKEPSAPGECVKQTAGEREKGRKGEREKGRPEHSPPLPLSLSPFLPFPRCRRGLLLLLLLLLCLLPRTFMAWKIGGMCNDAPMYIQVAESLDRGQLHEDKFNRLGLNSFPVILVLLHRLGLDWELAGKLWNVAISCLTVLPLYGWVRRQFDDHVALAAGCLYALHSELIRSSPEGIRDPTFLFFLTLTLYWLWRAIAEVRLLFFFLGGLAMALVVMTRSEGLFLLVPLLLWSVQRGTCAHHRAPCLHGRRDEYIALRRKLLLGVVLAVGVFPALLVLASLFWFRGHAPWELVRTKPLEFVEMWIHTCLARVSAPGTVYSWSAAAGMPWTTMAGHFASALFKGLTPVFTLFTCIGVAGWWSTWKRRDHQAMFYTVLLFFLAIWIHLNVAQETTGRYFLPVALVMSPFAALGLLACSQRLLHWSESRRWGVHAAHLALWLPLLFFGVFSLGNVVLCDYRQRGGQADLGHWAGNEFGPSPALLGPCGVTQVVAHYGRCRYELFDPNEKDQVIENLIRQGSFDVVLLSNNHDSPHGRAELLRHTAGLGYGPLDDQPFCDQLQNMVVLTRRNSRSRH